MFFPIWGTLGDPWLILTSKSRTGIDLDPILVSFLVNLRSILTHFCPVWQAIHPASQQTSQQASKLASNPANQPASHQVRKHIASMWGKLSSLFIKESVTPYFMGAGGSGRSP